MKAICLACGNAQSIGKDGTFYVHGPRDRRCIGSIWSPQGQKDCMIPAPTESQAAMIRECWRVGDWRPLELEFGVDIGTLIASGYEAPQGESIDAELAAFIRYVRYIIDAIVLLSNAAAQRGYVPPAASAAYELTR